MSSETITRNDLTAILNEVLPPTPSEYRKLLWTNPSPSSAFGAQTISLDLSTYDEIEVIAKPYVTQTTYFMSRGVVNNGSGIIFSQTGYGSPVRIYGTQRSFTPTSTGVAFGAGLDFSATTDNNYCVPYKIYGIKYERVAPPQTDVDTLTVNINGIGAEGTLSAFRYGRLVLVTGLLRPKLTGTGLTLATVVNTPSIGQIWAQCGGYANTSQELYMNANSSDVIFNVSAISDLKINFCYITTD